MKNLLKVSGWLKLFLGALLCSQIGLAAGCIFYENKIKEICQAGSVIVLDKPYKCEAL